jgi:transcriptional regulator with XRE-family HTH domain
MQQIELSVESGLARSYISKIEKGTQDIKLISIFALAKALKVKPSRIIQMIEKYQKWR